MKRKLLIVILVILMLMPMAQSLVFAGEEETQINGTLELYSMLDDGSTLSAAKLSGGGVFDIGDKTQVTAYNPGYTFLGWYEAIKTGDVITKGELVSEDISFSYEISGDAALVAVFKANKDADVHVASSKPYKISVNGGSDKSAVGESRAYKLGTLIRLTATDDTFAYWSNMSGAVLGTQRVYEFKVVGNTDITAQYNTPNSGFAAVTFISGYNQISQRQQFDLEDVDDMTLPTAYDKTGQHFDHWSISGIKVSKADIISAVKAAIESDSSDDDFIEVTAVYEKDENAVTVTVYNGEKTEPKVMSANDGEKFTVKAEKCEGKSFSYWKDGNGNILSYNESYTFFVLGDITLTAVYGEDVTKTGVTRTERVIKKEGSVTFISVANVPSGCKIEKAGFVITWDEAIAYGSFNDETATIYADKYYDGNTYRYSLTVTKTGTAYVKAYLVYSDENGNMHTVYGDTVSCDIQNFDE